MTGNLSAKKLKGKINWDYSRTFGGRLPVSEAQTTSCWIVYSLRRVRILKEMLLPVEALYRLPSEL